MNNYPQAAGATVQNKNKCGSNGDSAAAPFLQGVKVKAMEFSRSEIGVRSREIPTGIMFNFCPFCGEKINVLLEATRPTGGSNHGE